MSKTSFLFGMSKSVKQKKQFFFSEGEGAIKVLLFKPQARETVAQSKNCVH